jgi:hypothetical protein
MSEVKSGWVKFIPGDKLPDAVLNVKHANGTVKETVLPKNVNIETLVEYQVDKSWFKNQGIQLDSFDIDIIFADEGVLNNTAASNWNFDTNLADNDRIVFWRTHVAEENTKPFFQPKYDHNYGKIVVNPNHINPLTERFDDGETIDYYEDMIVPFNKSTLVTVNYIDGSSQLNIASDVNWLDVKSFKKASVKVPVVPQKASDILNKYYADSLKERNEKSPPWAGARPTSMGEIPDGYKWNNPNLSYIQYVEVGWTNQQLIDKELLVPELTFDEVVNADLTAKSNFGTCVDPSSRYYDAGGIETIDIIKAKLTEEQLKGYLLGNIIKYSCRLNFKGSAERDAEKCKFYSQWLSELKGDK